MENFCKIALLMTFVLCGPAIADNGRQCVEINDNKKRLDCYDKLHGFKSKETITIVNLDKAPTPAREQASEVVVTAIDEPVNTSVITAAQEAYDNVIANSQTLKISRVSKSKSRKTYYFTTSGRVFLKLSDTNSSFRENDIVTLELGFLGSLSCFLFCCFVNVGTYYI